MLHPFSDEKLEPTGSGTFSQRSDKENELLVGSDGISDVDFQISSHEIKDHHNFLQPIDVILRPHFSSANGVTQSLLDDRLPPQMVEIVGRYSVEMKEAAESIRRAYKVYVETAVDESLYKEAMRLERRYFGDKSSPQQQSFLKLKRFYEKIKTFNQSAKKYWREITKAMDNLMVMNATRSLAYRIEKEYLKSLVLILRQTDSFLDELRIFLKVKEESSDPITGSIKIQVDFDPTKIYTIAAALGIEENTISNDIKKEEIFKEEVSEEEGSIALNIVLETREHKLNRASLISVPILGSRDWNRTPEYRFEVPLSHFEKCVEQFQNSYHVNVSEDNIKTPAPSSTIGVSRGVGENVIVEYKKLIVVLIDQIAKEILDDDFPGLAHPELFLYHCGCNVLYRNVLKFLRKRRMGEMLFVEDSHTTSMEFPEELIQKILIDWWTDRFCELEGEDVDSYLTYSRQLEMVKRDYRILYDEGSQLVRKEQPSFNYMRVETWILKNMNKVFGIRKVEIFKRFIKSQLLNT